MNINNNLPHIYLMLYALCRSLQAIWMSRTMEKRMTEWCDRIIMWPLMSIGWCIPKRIDDDMPSLFSNIEYTNLTGTKPGKDKSPRLIWYHSFDFDVWHPVFYSYIYPLPISVRSSRSIMKAAGPTAFALHIHIYTAIGCDSLQLKIFWFNALQIYLYK